ncbi:hypothetical protein [Pseudemcibacter aquimaris]|uniref:hypothetical protein n=1 Tax=Pseudemcibacter aquimaris TaxID=2857064 RepID=UPI002012F90D|nr:hypothetical protein [Pseudemcibacter aquimaris]MCC3859682.1 hypothetical protein [Pseudemcibacter aquimaris]WDU60077.1 hypothetical protein KW060_07375 [Pseudemcibacter aquimaris]
MKQNRNSLLIILVSLVFAGLIIFADYMLDGTTYNETVKYMLIAVWFVPFSWLSYKSGSQKE